MLFDTFFIAGFECSAMRRNDGVRLDLIASTQHDRFASADYRAAFRHGMRAARDGIRWHLIDRSGAYDWSTAIPMISAARDAGCEVVWDLAHFGCPEDVDIWSAEFVGRFARYAAHAARIIGHFSDPPHYFCLMNEISFWAWAGAERGEFYPSASWRGHELKVQLVRANIAAAAAIKGFGRGAKLVTSEPLIHVAAMNASRIGEADARTASQFEAVDMVMGLSRPDLGGRPEYVDVIGVNFYPFNQWFIEGPTIPFGHYCFVPLHDLLGTAYSRYRRPIVISETAAEGNAKASWLHYVMQEVALAAAQGVPVEAVCLYPIIDYRQWTEERTCSAGLWSSDVSQTGERRIDPMYWDALRRQQSIVSEKVASR